MEIYRLLEKETGRQLKIMSSIELELGKEFLGSDLKEVISGAGQEDLAIGDFVIQHH